MSTTPQLAACFGRAAVSRALGARLGTALAAAAALALPSAAAAPASPSLLTAPATWTETRSAVSVPEFDTPEEEIVWLLRELRSPEPPPADLLRDALVLRGDRIVEPLLEVLAAERVPALPDAGPQKLSIYQRALVLDSLVALDSRAPALAAQRLLVAEWSPDHRAAALRVLGATGDAGCVTALLAGAAPPLEQDEPGAEAGDSVPPRKVRAALEAALSELLAREPEAWDLLDEQWYDSSDGVLGPVVKAIGSARDPRGVALLAEILIWRPALAQRVAAELRALGPGPDPEENDTLALRLERLLDPEDPQLSGAVVLALGALGSFRPTPGLIELLEPERGLQGNSHWALQELTGLRLPADRALWTRWYADELAWFEREFPRVERTLNGGEKSEIAAALRDLATHRYERHTLAEAVSLVLLQSHAELRVQACSVLQLLGSKRAVPQLETALDDPSPEVVSAAHAALLSLTGLSYPVLPAR